MRLYWDPTLILLLPAIILGFLAQSMVDGYYRKFSQISAKRSITAASAAEDILTRKGMGHINVVMQKSRALTDHYDPRTSTLVLSEPIYIGYSIAALGIAAHEVGHAIQHAEGYFPLKIRNSIVPVAQFGSRAAFPLLLLGILFSFTSLIWVGIALYSFAVLFTLITLPVEFNASARALECLETGGFLAREEVPGVKKVLRAAAVTYVASALSAILQLARLLLLAGGDRRRRY